MATKTPLPQRHASQDETPRADTGWYDLVKKIEKNDRASMSRLYDEFCKGIRLAILQQLGQQEGDDRFHELFLTVTRAIRRGDLREPDRLMGFVRTILRRQVADRIEYNIAQRRRFADSESAFEIADQRQNPERMLIAAERQRLAKRALSKLQRRDREILERFYLREETQEEICHSMQLTDTQFRLYKSRAKARFGATGRRIAGLE